MKLIITNGEHFDKKEDETVLSPLLGHNIFDISEYAVDSEFEEIDVKCLNQIPLGFLSKVLTTYVKKLRRRGTITIEGRDLYLVALNITNRVYNLGEANAALYGGPQVHQLFASLVGVNDVVEHLEELGLKVLTKGFSGCNFRVVAERE